MKSFLLLAFLAAAFLLPSCTKNSQADHTIKYNISSTSAMNVTYTDRDGLQITANNVSSNWTYNFSAPGNGQTIKLIINSVNGSAVSGSIFIDGQQATQGNSSTGSLTLTAQIP